MSTPKGFLQYPSIPNNGFDAIAYEYKFTCEMTDSSYTLNDYTKYSNRLKIFTQQKLSRFFLSVNGKT